MKKWFKRLLLLFLILLLGVLAIAAIYLYNKKPQLSGDIVLHDGVTADTEIVFDRYGVPHIYAQNENDAYFALGYVHAQDRLFQMEVLRRLASGRLSEIFGKDLLTVDKMFRTLSLSQHADKVLAESSSEQNTPYFQVANAYVKGVNTYITQGNVPVEFDLLGIEAQPFTLKDCLLIGGYMAFSFSESFKQDPLVTYIQQKYGEAYLKDLVTSWHGDDKLVPVSNGQTNNPTLPVAPPQAQLLQQDLQGFAALMEHLDRQFPAPIFQGSNAWLIAPNKTQTGKAILSNDTHIGFAQPCVWYEANLNYGNQNFYGSFLAGVPVAMLGHNLHFAWGMTMFENDDVDFYVEKPNPANPEQVWEKNHWQDLGKRTETIHIKGQADTTISVRWSSHGVLVNSLSPYFDSQKNTPIAMWWVYTLFPQAPLSSMYALSKVQRVEEAREHLAKIHAPGLNIMTADSDGNIGWWAVGKIPRRDAHVNTSVFLDGASGKDDVTEWYDFDKNPYQFNPASGYIASANSQPANTGIGLIPGYYQAVDRYQRIATQLEQKNDWTAASVRQLINDDVSSVYPTVLAQILPLIKPQTTNEQQAYQLLQQWKGEHTATSIAPTIFYRFWWHLHRLALQDEMGKQHFAHFLTVAIGKKTMPHLLKNPDSPWWDNVQTPSKENRDELLQQSFALALTDLEQQLGKDPNQWQWEKVHLLTHEHPIGKVKPFDKWLNVGPFGAAGGREVINNLDFIMDSTGIYRIKGGPALRRIVDFSEPTQATSCLPTGQSGNPFSSHYSDQALLYVKGASRSELMDRAKVLEQQEGVLWLRKSK
jgi:penicillin amidase